jgi:hypothetical protein
MKITKHNNTCLLINFGQKKDLSNLLKNGNYSIGINSQFADVNYDFFEAAQKKIKIDSHFFLDLNAVNSSVNIYAEYIEQLTRWNISDTNFSDPRHLYDDFLNSLNYWYNFLKFFDIQKIYFVDEPHRAYDLLIYKLAKYLKIKIFIFSELNTGYRWFIKQNIDDTLLEVDGDFPFVDKSVSIDLRYNHLHTQFRKTDYLSKFYFILKIFTKFDSYIYSQRKAFIKIPTYKYWMWKIKAIIKTGIYNYHYKKCIKTVSINDKDIIFFLHYEPERTSNPLSGNARNQLFCIKMLRQSFPEKKIYIKEHPSQLNLKSKHGNRQFRDKIFLDEIVSISDGLIDKVPNDINFIVATLNGTAGVEYSIKGHNVLCFGKAWYSFLKNVYHVKSCEDLININFDKKNNTQEIEENLKQMLYSKSAKGNIKLQKDGRDVSNEIDDSELLSYVRWYFNIT